MDIQVILTLFGSVAFMSVIGIPVSFAIGSSSLLTIMLSLPFYPFIIVITQKLATGLDSFFLLAILFFILAGNIINRGKLLFV
ncbi:MAG: hypothetical protein CENE_02558 [Candidatus Celerinatantimonas neptuna]|nr:MAG: hypothetical protein CENE_02558 [Candidatus Celerinatantimonas neptuna]